MTKNLKNLKKKKTKMVLAILGNGKTDIETAPELVGQRDITPFEKVVSSVINIAATIVLYLPFWMFL